MHISVKSSHLSSGEHKKSKIWCEDCSKYISDKTRHFQSEIHLRNEQNNQPNQQNTQSAFGNFSLDTQQSCPSVQCTQSASGTQHPSVQSASGTQQPSVQLGNNSEGALHVKLIVNENTYIKLKVNPTENLEYHIKDLLSKNYFPRYQYQWSYLA